MPDPVRPAKRRSAASRSAPGISAALLAVTVWAAPAHGKQAFFDPQMMFQGAGGTAIDTARFERGNFMEPGTHRLDVYVNGQWRGVEELLFRQQAGGDGARPCYDSALLGRLGLDVDKAARGDGMLALSADGACGELARYVPGAQVKVEVAEQKLYLAVPKYYLRLSAPGAYVDPSNWESGVTAARLNYNSNLFTSESRGSRTTRGYAGLNVGLNVGAFRLRHYGSATWSPGHGARYQRGYTYLKTDVPAWKSQLLMGESSTEGDLFDSVSFRGVQLASDERMLPSALRSYTPVVRGTANSNAQVTVYQRGYLVYETTVAPGPFAIEDLQAAGYGGDLDVRIVEADGSTRSFVVPFATTVQLLRPGASRYNLTAGRAIDLGMGSSSQYLFQGTLKRGLGDMYTGYGGLAFTRHYGSALAGAAVNTAMGAFAADVTLSRARLPEEGSRTGASYRLSYSKNLPNSGTNFSLLAYRYSTSGFVGLRESIALQGTPRRYRWFGDVGRTRGRLDANISQQLGANGGNVYLSGSAIQYWQGHGNTINFALGYSNRWRDISYSLGVQRMQNLATRNAYRGGGRDNSTLVTVNLSIPLGQAVRGAPTLNTYYSADSRAGANFTTSVAGTVGESNRGTYSVSATHASRENANSASANIGYRLPQAWVGAGVSQGSGYRQASFNASGGVLAHAGGVTFSQTLGETVALVRADDAEGALIGYGGDRLDGRGYGVVASLSPYQLNTVDIDPRDIPDDVELQASSRNVAPRAGAVVLLTYPTRVARPVLINGRQADGAALPFGAEVLDANSGKSVGAVGQGSRIVMRVEQDQGRIVVQWGPGAQQRCSIEYALPERARQRDQGYAELSRTCTPIPADGPWPASPGPLARR
ncbi:fimbrial biogenesis outer membrane usher protein [Achromobacter pestifer]|uniref:Fimbrial biogenesis outer membrane usher protein n=1 Tax=Achromobacter pestifer TaxID=1353889 RepID=A0A7D4HTR4_9BURK|nr:fimbria/pilus outer membrane usher protein [Achromobacter pestifer]QKH36233.1 fimbrial biogenesis outer membrane usher protein [Achromobacter pestifer]